MLGCSILELGASCPLSTASHSTASHCFAPELSASCPPQAVLYLAIPSQSWFHSPKPQSWLHISLPYAVLYSVVPHYCTPEPAASSPSPSIVILGHFPLLRPRAGDILPSPGVVVVSSSTPELVASQPSLCSIILNSFPLFHPRAGCTSSFPLHCYI